MRYIMTIVENNGNLTRAAARLFVTQPALTQVLKKVEAEVGATLFERGKSPMPLTKAGKSFVRAVRTIENIYGSMRREFDDERNLETGELHIGVTPFRATYLLPDVLAAYHRKQPGINIILHQAANATLLRLMENFQTDITIGNFQDNKIVTDNAVCKTLSDEEMIIVAPPDHPFAAAGRIDAVSNLEGELIMMSPAGEPMRTIIDDFFERNSFTPTSILETNNAEFCLRMISAGVGVSIMSESILEVKTISPAPAFIRFPSDQPPPRLVTSAAYLKHKYLSFAARAFMKELEKG
jgi:DNA-binding transcriptional LysR family regulator